MLLFGHRRSRCGAAFTLLELMTVVVVIAILVVLIAAGLEKLRSRAQRTQCAANLRALHAGAALHLQEHERWPQIFLTSDDDSAVQEFAKDWIAALSPYGVEAKTWICPTRQALEKTEYWKPEAVRIDYRPFPYDDKPTTPHQWPNFFWFAEEQSPHGRGQLMIFPDGSVKDAETFAAEVSGGKK